MNLDTLVKIGSPPWRPAPAADDIDIWDKADFPTCGTFRLRGDLVVFTLVTAAGRRSLWAYVPVPADDEARVAGAAFDTTAAFYAFVAGCFTSREAVFAAAEDLVIGSKSDGTLIASGKHALLRAGTAWYAQRIAADAGRRQAPVVISDDADAATALREAQGILAESPV